MQNTALPTLLYVGLTVLLVAIFSQECAARSPSQLHLCRVASSARYLQFCKCSRGPGSRWTPDGFASSSESRKSCENNAKAVRYIRRSRLWHGKVLTTKMYKCKFNHEHGILLLTATSCAANSQIRYCTCICHPIFFVSKSKLCCA